MVTKWSYNGKKKVTMVKNMVTVVTNMVTVVTKMVTNVNNDNKMVKKMVTKL